MSQIPRKLLVLDLDETLIHATGRRIDREEDFRVGHYYVYLRPHLDQFVSFALSAFSVGVWTSSGETYAEQVIQKIFPQGALEFVWSSQRCTPARDWTTGEYTTIKNLRKLKARGYRLESVIAVDDTPSKHAKNYGNLVTVREFLGAQDDDELLLLTKYLQQLVPVQNVRTVEKRFWRKRMQDALETPRDRPPGDAP